MTTEILLVTLTAIAALTASALWLTRARPRPALAFAQSEDMFAYTMQDDPC
jgi:hypothetical protein